MKISSKKQLFVCICVLLLMYSCDFVYKEYYNYTSNDGYNEAYILWNDSSRCGLIINDTTLIYDEVNLVFPSDNSNYKGYCEKYFKNIRNDKDEIIDSAEFCAWYFDIQEKDPKLDENTFAILHVLNHSAQVSVDTLYRKKEIVTLLDRIPLPKMH